jgi:hypothetical protein
MGKRLTDFVFVLDFDFDFDFGLGLELGVSKDGRYFSWD